MAKVYSVHEVNAYIGNLFSQDFLLNKVSVRGELSNLKDHPSGHLYFTLKDAESALSGVMFQKSRLRGLKSAVREGMKVVVTGEVRVYEQAGRYQIYAEEIVPDGLGDLHQRFLELKTRLSEMGMFDPQYKKPVPKYAMTVGVVTAETGAALQDILNIAARRNPFVQIVLSPALVQGDQAPPSIIRAIEAMDRQHPDLMIVCRGGGSQEDLFCFNDEGVARAIFDCETPVISAVGHEVDFTIADFVADLRAPTPSAAAELAFFDYRAYLENLSAFEDRMRSAEAHALSRLKLMISEAGARLISVDPRIVVENQKTRLQELKFRLNGEMRIRLQGTEALLERKKLLMTHAVTARLESAKNRFKVLSGALNGNSPLKKLSGGYGYISKEGRPVTGISGVRPGDAMEIRLHDGRIFALAESTGKEIR